MARPTKDPSLRRNIRLEVRLTSDEERALLNRSQERGLTLSDFIRLAALAVKPRHVQANPDRAALIKALSELGKLGSNVNQIARAINRQQAAGQRMDMPAEAAARVLHEIETLSSALIKRLSDGH